jgi:moderate conductance mechanosensitive channel
MPKHPAARANYANARCVRWWPAALRRLALMLLLLPWLASSAIAASEPAAAKSAGEALTSSTIDSLESAAAGLTERLRPILSAAADLPADLGQFGERLTNPAQGSLGAWSVKLAIALAAALAAALLVPAWTARLWQGASRAESSAGSKMLVALLGDLLGILLLLAVFYTSHALWFSDGSVRSVLAISLLGALVHWRLAMLPVDLLLRHREPEARLIRAGDLHAAEMRRLAAWLLGFVVLSQAMLRTFLHAGVPIPAVQFIALLVGLANASLALYFIRRLRGVLKEIPAAGVGEVQRNTLQGRIWYPLALAFILAMAIAWVLGAILDDLAIYWTLRNTGAVLLGVLILQSVLAVWLARAVSAETEAIAVDKTARWRRLIRRCIGVLLWLCAAVLIIETWMGPLAHVLPVAQWQTYRGSVVSAAVTLYIAYVLWQIVFMHTERQLPMPGQAQSDDNAGPAPIASRIQTMMPVLRIFMLITIALLAALIALSDLGVNTTSLIAGASIFGLAISFGSQSLVHDIVSGIFFMADDAFRIGEYIDTGKAKGSVEGMSVRSLRLRHQNGQIHVIPFGQIQQVTNFSRDWTTVKFNLRLQLNTDIEKVRKTVKQIGAEMMQDPVFAAELFQPLKMQGVTDIDPNGLIVRLKFTARPVQPSLIQREALKRISKHFREKGIEFASANMMVQTVTGPGAAVEAAKAAPLAASTAAGTPQG